MRKLSSRELLTYVGIAVLLCVLVMSWSGVVGFVSIVLTAIIPLVLGAAIAYVVTIPLGFLERHFLPNSTSKAVAALRRPLCLGVTVIALLMVLFFATSTLAPALVEVVVVIQDKGGAFVESLLQLPVLEPVRDTVREFLEGDFMQSLASMDIGSIIKSIMGGTVGTTIGSQLFSVVSTIMTGFFGIVFSFILLTDTSGARQRALYAFAAYMGHERMEKIALLTGVADASFHNFIVRQCVEALILGTVGTVALFASGFEYPLGVGALMGVAALVPVVGYPVGLFAGTLMVAVISPLRALLYLVCVAVAQMLESSLVLPRIGDPRTTLPPVWVAVAVTIGGGVAGFIGMLVAIPVAATIYQLIRIDLKRRGTPLPQE